MSKTVQVGKNPAKNMTVQLFQAEHKCKDNSRMEFWVALYPCLFIFYLRLIQLTRGEQSVSHARDL